MRVFCSGCGKKCVVSPNDLVEHHHTEDDYLCKKCSDKKKGARHCGPQMTLNMLKQMARQYQMIHIGLYQEEE